jgi:hypothetical protein
MGIGADLNWHACHQQTSKINRTKSKRLAGLLLTASLGLWLSNNVAEAATCEGFKHT